MDPAWPLGTTSLRALWVAGEAGDLDVDEAGVEGRIPDVVLVELLAALGPHGPQGAGGVDPVDQGWDPGQVGGLVEGPDDDVGRAGRDEVHGPAGQLGGEGGIGEAVVVRVE